MKAAGQCTKEVASSKIAGSASIANIPDAQDAKRDQSLPDPHTHVTQWMESTCVQAVAIHIAWARAAKTRDQKNRSTVWNECLCGHVDRVCVLESLPTPAKHVERPILLPLRKLTTGSYMIAVSLASIRSAPRVGNRALKSGHHTRRLPTRCTSALHAPRCGNAQDA